MPLKTCDSCGAKHGPRTRVCPCGHVFQAKPKPEPALLPITTETVGAAVTGEPAVPKGKPNVYAIAGKPPPYEGDLSDWLEQVKGSRPEYQVTYDAAVCHLQHATQVDSNMASDLRELMAIAD